MDIDITIKGRLTIAEDELDYFEAMGTEEVATALIRHSSNVKVEIRVIYVSEKVRKGGK